MTTTASTTTKTTTTKTATAALASQVPVFSKLINTRTDFDECYEFGSEVGK
jgi:hypothetical protein